MINNNQGIFGPGGHGGGIFQTTVSGLGAFDPFTGVPANCWAVPAFKTCVELASKKANDSLYSMLNKGELDYKPESQEWTDHYNVLWHANVQACQKSSCAPSTTAPVVKKPTVNTGSSSSTSTPSLTPGSSYSPGTPGMSTFAPTPFLDTTAKKVAAVAGVAVFALGAFYLWSSRK